MGFSTEGMARWRPRSVSYGEPRRAVNHYGVPERFDEPLTRRWARAISNAIAGAPESESFHSPLE